MFGVAEWKMRSACFEYRDRTPGFWRPAGILVRKPPRLEMDSSGLSRNFDALRQKFLPTCRPAATVCGVPRSEKDHDHDGRGAGLERVWSPGLSYGSSGFSDRCARHG